MGNLYEKLPWLRQRCPTYSEGLLRTAKSERRASTMGSPPKQWRHINHLVDSQCL